MVSRGYCSEYSRWDMLRCARLDEAAGAKAKPIAVASLVFDQPRTKHCFMTYVCPSLNKLLARSGQRRDLGVAKCVLA